MKPQLLDVYPTSVGVASRAEAWIETVVTTAHRPRCWVASRAEAWIETVWHEPTTAQFTSPPVRRRGLKLHRTGQNRHQIDVASRAEAWIETRSTITFSFKRKCRLPCGGVD